MQHSSTTVFTQVSWFGGPDYRDALLYTMKQLLVMSLLTLLVLLLAGL